MKPGIVLLPLLMASSCSTVPKQSRIPEERSDWYCLYLLRYGELLHRVEDGDDCATRGIIKDLPNMIRCQSRSGAKGLLQVATSDAYGAVMALTIYQKQCSLDFLDELSTPDKQFMISFYAYLDAKGQIAPLHRGSGLKFSEVLEKYLRKHPEIDKTKVTGQQPPEPEPEPVSDHQEPKF